MARRALTFPELAGVVKAAGWPADLQATAVAVAFGESSGRPWVVNSSGHAGLFQISPLHTDLRRTGNVLDPVDNARMAYALYRQQGWDAWVVHSTGAYRMYLPRAMRAVGSPAAPPSSSPGSGGVRAAGLSEDLTRLAAGASGFTGFLNLVTNPRSILRAGMIVLGFILMFGALMQVSGTMDAVSGMVKTAVGVRVGKGRR